MNLRLIHRWVGLTAGAVALVLGITGAILAFYPVRDAWLSVPAEADLTVSTLVERVAATIPGVEEIRHLPAGDIVVYSFAGDQARAAYVDPADGRVLGDYQPSALSRWVKNLHRSFLLGDTGRLAAAGIALAMFILSVSGLVLLIRRLGGWQRLTGRLRGSLSQRIHATTGRILLVTLWLTAVTALYMTAVTFELIPTDADVDPDVISVAGPQGDLPAGELPLLQSLRVGELRRLNFPGAGDPEDTWTVVTASGEGWIDRYSGRTLAWVPAPPAQRIYDWAMLLHTGEGAWLWALVLGISGTSIPLFWISGLLIWWQGRRTLIGGLHNSAVSQADVLIFVASETGGTWGFAQALHQALVRNHRRVHTTGLENFQAHGATQHILILAATYGDGKAPAHAAQALTRIARLPAGTATATVLGFGDRQFAAFCAYAEAVDQALRAQGWAQLLPLERIHQQSAQEFACWGETLAKALSEPLTLNHVPRTPPTTTLTLLSRRDYPGGLGEPTVVLRFTWPSQSWQGRLLGRGLPHFEAGDLVGILPPDTAVPRYYSLASAYQDGFLEICVRKMPGGVCSGYLHALQPGDTIQAFIKSNPGFVLEGARHPVVLIGAGTGVAPLAGFIRNNTRHIPMHLYYGTRDPAKDFYFDRELREWLGDRRLASLQTTFSRIPDGGGYVQDALRRDAARLQDLVANGAVLRVCGSRPMANGVAETLDGILATLRLNVQQLKDGGRYAEDVF